MLCEAWNLKTLKWQSRRGSLGNELFYVELGILTSHNYSPLIRWWLFVVSSCHLYFHLINWNFPRSPFCSTDHRAVNYVYDTITTKFYPSRWCKGYKWIGQLSLTCTISKIIIVHLTAIHWCVSLTWREFVDLESKKFCPWRFKFNLSTKYSKFPGPPKGLFGSRITRGGEEF